MDKFLKTRPESKNKKDKKQKQKKSEKDKKLFLKGRILHNMKLEIERSEFLKAWQLAEKSASSKTTVESTSGIFINADSQFNQPIVTLEATDLKTSVKCCAQGVNVLEPGSAVLPVSLLGSLLKKIKADKIIIEVNNERGVLTAGKSRTRFTIIPVADFPGIPKSNSAEEICEILAQDFIKLVNEGSCASSTPADFPKYLGTCLLRTNETCIKAVSTDGKRLSLSQNFCTIKKIDDLLLPAAALKELAKNIQSNSKSESLVKILSDGSTVWFKLDDIEFSIRRIEAPFPAYERILNKDIRTTLKIDCDEFNSALDRIDVIAKTTPTHIAAISMIPNGELKITTRAPDLGASSEVIDSNDAKIDGAQMVIGFNVGYLQDGLKAMGACEVSIEFSDVEGQARLFRSNSEDFLYMLMPARLSPQDIITDDEISDFAPSSQTQISETDSNPEPEQEPVPENFETQEPEQEQDSWDNTNSEQDDGFNA